MRGNDTLTAILAILKELDGYFVFTDEHDEEFVIAPRHKVTIVDSAVTKEQQLRLEPVATPFASDMHESLLEDMNRAIALTRDTEQDVAFDDIGVAVGEYESSVEVSSDLPPPRRVRFEPLRGDLPPELQE